ncbi:MAG TPA: DsrE family protein [Acidobacteriota bacterium]|nr:DsrE family protein [Acidobacteriota bacterium]
MKKMLIGFSIALAVMIGGVAGRFGSLSGQESQNSRLAVLWTSGDPEVAHHACFMYTDNAKKQKWFDEVTLIVWGPSARLLAGDKDLQAKIKGMLSDGVRVQACQACTDSYGVTEQLRQMGVEVKYMGKPFTDLIKQGWHILTY